MSRPSGRCGSVGSFWPTAISTSAGVGQLERDLLTRVGRADDEDPALRQILRALVLGAVELGQLGIELVGDRRA